MNERAGYGAAHHQLALTQELCGPYVLFDSQLHVDGTSWLQPFEWRGRQCLVPLFRAGQGVNRS